MKIQLWIDICQNPGCLLDGISILVVYNSSKTKTLDALKTEDHESICCILPL